MHRSITVVVGLMVALVLVFGSVSWVAAQDGNGATNTLFLPVVLHADAKDSNADTPDVSDSADDAPDTAEYGTARLEVVELVNSEREALGCPNLVVDDTLMEATQGWSAYMAENSYFEHTEQAWYEEYGTWRSYENILRGCDTAQCAVDTWMASDMGHREALLVCKDNVTDYFVGVGREGSWWTLAIRTE